MSEEHKSDTITIKKDSLWKYSTFILAALVVVGAFVVFSGNGSVTGNAANNPTLPAPPSLEVKADIDDDAVLGNAEAPVTIIEFSDYECPYCNRHHVETLPQIKSLYIETGKVKYVYRDFTPTLNNPSYHPNAVNAAMAAECAREQGGDEAYWKMNDALFANQGSNDLTNLKSIASGFGYDIGQCLDSEKFISEVRNDLADAQAAGCQGTPCSVVVGEDGKGVIVSGAQPFSAFQQVIEQKLA